MCAQLSHRGTTFPASPIRKLVPFALEAKSKGTHVYHLNIGQPDIESPTHAMKALHDFREKRSIIAYSHSQGESDYLDTLQRYYQGVGIELSPQQINVTTGGSEAILFAMLITLNPGDEILIPEPFYTNYNAFAQIAGARIRPITTRVEEGFHLPSSEEIEAQITPQTKAVLLCNPNNPTGTVYQADELQRIAQIAQKHDLWLLSDEVYREFIFDAEDGPHRSAMQLEGLEERTLVMDSISKRYSMCGARIGCLLSRNSDVMDAALRLAQARLSSPQIEQQIAAAAHTMPADYLPGIIDVYRRRRDVVYQALQAIPGVEVARPEGAFYTIPRLPIQNTEDFAKWLLTDFSVEGETVMVAPAAGFYATPGLGLDEIRIAYVLQEERLKRAMDLLQRAIFEYNASH